MPIPYGTPYGGAYYGGGGSSALSPYLTEVALGGHGYLLEYGEEASPPGLNFISVPLQKEQYDTSPSPGEQSINPEAFWRRARESWHLGAGQVDCDREESSPYRFRSSTHLDIWTKNKLCLHPETVAKTVSANTNQKVLVVGDRIYYVNGTALGFYTDIVGGSITNITGVPGTAPNSIASDGFNVVTAHGASGIYKTTRTGPNTTASHVTGTVNLVAFVKGRFLAANANSVYDVTSLVVGGGGALGGAIFTQGNTDFSWVGFAEGSGWIYAAGFSGDKSLIYKTQVREDGTALTAFSVAAELPDGEIVQTIYGYLGRFLVIGTNKGFRFAVVTGTGDLSVGVMIETPAPVLCFEAQGKFIWFGYGSYSSGTNNLTGLGRMSTEDFVNLELLQPAYASDLMVHNQVNNVTSVVSFNGRLVFTINAIGMYYQGTNLEPTGWLDTGRITYGTTEHKVGLWVNLQHVGTGGKIEVLASANDSVFISLGERDAVTSPMEKLSLGETVASGFELRLTLKRNSSILTDGPCLLSWLMRAQPKSEITVMMTAALRLAPWLEDLSEVDRFLDVMSEQDYIENLHRDKTITTFEVLGRTYSVIVEDFQGSFLKLIPNTDGLGFTANEVVIIKMKRIE